MLVLTTLTKEALPLVRYWTGDICSLERDRARAGGRSSAWARSSDAPTTCSIVRGVNVYPSQVGAVLGRIPELSPHFGLVVRREGTLDSLEVLVEPASSDACDAVTLIVRTAALLRETIGCTMRVTVVNPGEAPRSDGGKIQRVQDLR